MWLTLLRIGCNCFRCISLLCGKVLPDPSPTSRFCAFFSFTGILFMLWVGVMISTQSFYIKGIEDPDQFKNSAFGAMGGFIFTFSASIIYLIYEACCLSNNPNNAIGGSQSYERVPTGGSGGLHGSSISSGLGSLPPGMTDYEVNMELASSSASNSPVDSDARSYSSSGSETRRRRKAGSSPSSSTRETLGLGGELI